MRKSISYLGSAILLAAIWAVPVSATTAGDFLDVPTSHPYYASIMDLRDRGIISGYPDGTYKPDQAVNRVEALKIILNAAKIDAASSQVVASFSDTTNDQWYSPFLNKAVELKIVAGYPDGTFKPTQTVNLVENLKMLLNAHGIDSANVMVMSAPFADTPMSEWYIKFVQYAKDKKLIEGDSMNKVYPAQGMTRGKLAEVAFRLIYIQENDLDYFGQLKDPIGDPGDQTLVVNIKDFAFNKSEMTIAQGTTVRWTNLDNVKHDITSTTGKFESPALDNGDTWEHTFNDLGTFEYFCSLHPAMTGKLIVKPAEQVPTI
jgi:plastocyanin